MSLFINRQQTSFDFPKVGTIIKWTELHHQITASEPSPDIHNHMHSSISEAFYDYYFATILLKTWTRQLSYHLHQQWMTV